MGYDINENPEESQKSKIDLFPFGNQVISNQQDQGKSLQ